MEKSGKLDIKDDFSPFLDKLHSWKISSRETIVEIVRDLEDKATEEKHLSGLVHSLKLENEILSNTVTDLQETINFLTVFEEENRNIKLEIKNLRLENEKRSEVHQAELVETKKSLNEKIEQGERERRDLMRNLNEELKKQTLTFELKLSAVNNEKNELLKLQEEMKREHQNEIRMLELEKQTEINYLQQKLEDTEQKSLQNNRSLLNQDIFRRKLLNLQAEYSSKIQTLTNEIDVLKKQLDKVNCREPNEKLSIEESQNGNNSIENAPKNVKPNKKRKLYCPESSNVLLNSSP